VTEVFVVGAVVLVYFFTQAELRPENEYVLSISTDEPAADSPYYGGYFIRGMQGVDMYEVRRCNVLATQAKIAVITRSLGANFRETFEYHFEQIKPKYLSSWGLAYAMYEQALIVRFVFRSRIDILHPDEVAQNALYHCMEGAFDVPEMIKVRA